MSKSYPFWSKVDKSGECWIWKGSLRANGYGSFGQGKAHRYAYESVNGLIPEGLEIDHLCRVRSCVRPDHLEAVTKTINILRSDCPPALNARKTVCKWGHPFTPENTRQRPVGGRECRICRRASKRGYKQRRKAAMESK